MNSLTRNIFSVVLLGILLLASQGFCRFDVWDTEDGVAVRQGDHIMWMNTGIQKTENGSYCLAWSDAHRGSQDVYVQMYNVEGQPRWGEEGLLISGGDWAEQEPQLAYLGDDEWMIIWRDFRDDHGKLGVAKHYAQCFDSNGEILWDEEVLISSPASSISQFQFEIAEDKSLIAIWLERNHIYGQRILHDGSLDWPMNGQLLGTYISGFDFVLTPQDEIAVVVYETEQDWFDGAVQVHKFDFYRNQLLEEPALIYDEFWLGDFRIENVNNNELLVLYEYRGIWAQLLNENSEPVWEVEGQGILLHEGTISLEYTTNLSANTVCYTYYDNHAYSFFAQLIQIDENLQDGYQLLWDEGNGDVGLQIGETELGVSHPVIQLDDYGNLIFSWRYFSADGTDSFGVTRYGFDGVQLWNEPYYSTFRFTPCGYSRAVVQLEDELLFVWNTNYESATGLFQQRIDCLTGEPRFEDNGISLKTGISFRADKPQLVVCEADAIVFWEEYRSNDRQFFMQKLDMDSGEPMFTEQGIEVYSNLAEREDITFTHYSVEPDGGNGSLFFANQLNSNGSFEEYRVNRIDNDGNLLWGDEGVFLRESRNN